MPLGPLAGAPRPALTKTFTSAGPALADVNALIDARHGVDQEVGRSETHVACDEPLDQPEWGAKTRGPEAAGVGIGGNRCKKLRERFHAMPKTGKSPRPARAE